MATSAFEIAKELSPGERLLWTGKPRGGIRFRPADIFIIPFSILWCGFAIFWEVMVLQIPGKQAGPIAIVFPLFGLPFVIVGLYFVFGRFFADARHRERTLYFVTSERVIIVSGLFTRRIKSLNLRTLSDISLSERSDGSGTITFGPTHAFSTWMPAGAWPGAGQFSAPMFDMVDEAKKVYDVIRQAQRTAT